MKKERSAFVFGVRYLLFYLLFALALHSLEEFLFGDVLFAELWGFDLRTK